MKQHVELADAPCAVVLFLTGECDVAVVAAVVDDIVAALDEHAAGATGGVMHPHAFLRLEQLDDELHDHAGRVELATLLARAFGKTFDEVFVGVAQYVGFGQIAIAQRDVAEVREQSLHEAVHRDRVAEATFVVEPHARHHSFEILAVVFFDGVQSLVDRLGSVLTDLQQVVPAGTFWDVVAA